MNAQTTRRHATRAAAILAASTATVALSACGSSDVTRARLERSLPQTFSNLYVKQAAILGHKGITVRSLHARAQCDKGGPKVADHGPGADWICQMSWKDPNVPLPDGFGKFEINAHSNDCYTAGGPSKLIGLLTITDTRGNDVPNPVFEFDTCFNPNGSNAPTGVSFPKPATTAPTPAAPPAPAALTLATGTLRPDRHHRVAPRLICSHGGAGCAGSVTATSDGHSLGKVSYALTPGGRGTARFTLPQTTVKHAATVDVLVKPVIGTGPRHHTSLGVSRR